MYPYHAFSGISRHSYSHRATRQSQRGCAKAVLIPQLTAEFAMKIFVIGGVAVPSEHLDYDEQARLLTSAMERLGSDVVTMGHELVACSPFDGSADVAAIRGAMNAL